MCTIIHHLQCSISFIPYQKLSRQCRQSQLFGGNFLAFCRNQDPEDLWYERDKAIHILFLIHLLWKPVSLDSLLKVHWSPSLPLFPIPRLPGLELLWISLDAGLEVVHPALLLLPKDAVSLDHFDVLRVNQLPVKFVRAEILVRVKFLHDKNILCG